TDGGTPTLTITASQQLNDVGALGVISSPYQLLVVPSATAQESNSGLTNNTTDTITVTASAAIGNSIATVAIYDGSIFLANATASGLGTWSYTATKLSNGDHAFHAVVTDSAGNTTTTAPLPTLTVDAAPPNTTISETVTLSSATTSPSVKVSGVASDSSGVASVYMNGGSTNLLGAGGIWSYMQNNLANGVHQYVATIADALGNTTIATGSTIQVNNNSNVALKGTVGGDQVNVSAGGVIVAITDTTGGNNRVAWIAGNGSVTINDVTGHNNISLTGGTCSITITDSSGGSNTVSLNTSNDKVTLSDKGSDVVNVLGSNGNETLVFSTLPSQADTIAGFKTNDIIGFLNALGLIGVDNNLNNGLAAHDVGWLYNATLNETFVYANPSGFNETIMSTTMPTLALAGNVALSTGNFKFHV
ncbi:Ig-like domain-containing protein, partial [Rhodoblastus sp. 17X3]|uniref:Ig-like domain-containing protein n=1 Tax=Rhodoblastus sp. 17X3 TaxID=3047026 RepID=UPI0024B71133